MRIHFFSAIVLAALVLTSAIQVRAWDDVGHKITAYIAWQRMSPKAREKAVSLLRAAPEDSHLSAFYANYGIEPEEIRKRNFFMLASTWADIVRDRAFETRYRKYHKSNWHYDDTFWKQSAAGVELLSGFEEGGQAVARLDEFSKLIFNSSAGDREKAIAIAWILHLIGDLHQPLHTSARVTDLEPKGDQGGNLFLLTPQGTPREQQQNLHWFWDSIVVRNVPASDGICERCYIEPLAEKIMKKYPLSTLKGGLAPADFEALQKESFKLNATNVFTPDLVRFRPPPDGYRKRAFQLAERQLALAGYRIGELLEKAFGGSN